MFEDLGLVYKDEFSKRSIFMLLCFRVQTLGFPNFLHRFYVDGRG